MARKPKAPLASWIVEQRKARGLKPADVAARLGVAETTIRGWETGRGVSAENVASLERLFGVEAPESSQPADMTALVAALHAQTDAIADLVRTFDRPLRVAETAAPYDDVDEATKRRRRRFWIERAMEEKKLNAEEIGRRMDWPSSQLGKVRAWVRGELPTGASRERFAAALSLPLHVLDEPPPDDHERLVQWRRESLATVASPEREEPARERRSA